MNTYRLGRLATLSLASLLAVACDDGATGGSAGGSAGSSTTGDSAGTDDAGSGETLTTASTAGDASDSNSTTEGEGSTSTGVDTADTDSGADASTTLDSDSADESGSSSGGGESSSTSAGSESDSDSDSESESDSDSDSDSAGETGGVIEICEAPGDLIPCDAPGMDGTVDPFNAMGLGCTGGPNNVIPILNDIFVSADDTAWRVVSQYGTHIDPVDGLPTWRPREGESMLMISTSTLPEPDENGILTQTPGNGGANGNPDGSALPAPMSPFPGSNAGAGGTPFVGCDGTGDCSDSLIDQWNAGGGSANDLLWFQFETQVPNGTFGFSFDFAYFSAEFPEWVDTTFNDIFLVWSDSESYTGNLCFVNDEPCTVTALWPPAFQEGDPVLEGTMFEASGSEGEATGWFQANGSAVPGELLQLTFAIFDMGDTAFDTLVLLDNFQWDCEGCTPSEVDPCIGIDPV
ncbi:MAG: choice-of-anchor L domain-containing protein [Myxococcota bacterium]